MSGGAQGTGESAPEREGRGGEGGEEELQTYGLKLVVAVAPRESRRAIHAAAYSLHMLLLFMLDVSICLRFYCIAARQSRAVPLAAISASTPPWYPSGDHWGGVCVVVVS